MPPIPVHLDDPITPQKAHGATPQTSDGLVEPPLSLPPNVTQQAASLYSPARPGAAAAPAPTAYVPRPAPEPTRTQPQAVQDAPPPPQPGAAPRPPQQQEYAPPTSSLPPPPKAGEASQQRATIMPSQMQIPPPAQNYAPTHSTTSYGLPATSFSGTGPTTVNLGPVAQQPPSDHPPGYHQDVQAQELSATQRSNLDSHQRNASVMGNLGGDAAGETAENVWNTVKSWVGVAGEKLAETEENVWKRINGR